MPPSIRRTLRASASLVLGCSSFVSAFSTSNTSISPRPYHFSRATLVAPAPGTASTRNTALHVSPLDNIDFPSLLTSVEKFDVSASPLDKLDLPSVLTSVETFDGSTIVDPVVVSGAFWSSLKAKLLSVIIGQILATIAFIALSSVVASQLPKLGDAVSGLFKDENLDKAKSTVAQYATSSADAVKARAAASGGIQPDFGKLVLCLLIDGIGTSSELIPFIGEATDVVWAPIAALGLRSLYGSNVIFGLEFLEEVLPFTDIIPLATICWGIETFNPDGNLAKTLGIGSYGMNAGTVVDVPSSDTDNDRGRYLRDADARK